jgi:hypothetical protein
MEKTELVFALFVVGVNIENLFIGKKGHAQIVEKNLCSKFPLLKIEITRDNFVLRNVAQILVE